jgi:hypothetical protein
VCMCDHYVKSGRALDLGETKPKRQTTCA